jgi:hypothetical protein
MKTLRTLALAGALAVSFGIAAQAQAPRAQVGTLACNVAAGQGLVFGSTRQVACTYTKANGQVERYNGEINRYGVDIGFTRPTQMMWAVLAATNAPPGTLAGKYVGVTAGGTVGAGGQVNVLIGGNANTVSLQPVSVEGGLGLNLAAGVAEINLIQVQ